MLAGWAYSSLEINDVVEETSTKEREAIIYTAQKSVGYLFL